MELDPAPTTSVHAETVLDKYRLVIQYIDLATQALWDAETETVGFPMCCAENARIHLLDAREQMVERLEEMAARFDGDEAPGRGGLGTPRAVPAPPGDAP